jgi:hypothetical protein
MVGYPKTINIAATGVQKDGNGVVNIPLPEPYARTFGLVAKGVGGVPTSFSINLEGSLDGANYTLLATVTVDGTIVWAVDKPVTFLRINVTALTLGPATSVNVTLLAVP